MDSLFFDDGSNPSNQGLMGMGIPSNLSMNPAMNVNNMDDWAGGNNNNQARFTQPTAATLQRQPSGAFATGGLPLPPHLQNGSAPTPLGPSTSASDLFFVDPVSPSPFGVDSLDSTFNTNNNTLPDLDDSMGLGLGMGFGNPAIQQYGANEPSRKRARSDYVDVTAGYGNYMPNTPGNNVFSAHAHQQAQKPNEYALQPVNSQRSGDYVVPADDQFSLSSLMTFHNAQQKIDQYMHQYNGAPAPNTGNNPTGSTFGTPVTKTEPISPPTVTPAAPTNTTTSTRATKSSTTGRGRKASAAAAAAAAAASSGMDDDSVGSGNARPSPHDDSDDEEEGGRSRGGADDGRKKKHRMTDRQRRAKIKEGMDQLKALVPLDTSQKADQATIVASSVQLVHSLKDEIAALKSKLETIEAKDKDAEARRDELSSNFNFFNMGKNRVGPGPASLVSPFASLMASLNGAGVAMWRLGLDGRLLEVNMVFEMISGFHSAEIVGKSPCAPPLRGTLSCIPSQYLRSFATLDAFTTHGQPGNTNNNSSNSSTAASSPHTPSTPPGQTATPNVDAASPTSPIPNEGQGALFGGANMHSLPHLPDSALRSFFPSKISHCEPEHISLPERVPSMHGVYLIHHLLNLPNNNVLKLLSRHATSYGDTLESIVTLCLVRGGPDGAPQYILSMNTPDSRRLLKTTRTTTL